jgi:uncharacterized protein
VSNELLCTVYRCSREPDLYVYVDRSEGLGRLPRELLDRLGNTSEVLTLKLTPERKLARAHAAQVLAAIAERGYYLQLPPDKQVSAFTHGG